MRFMIAFTAFWFVMFVTSGCAVGEKNKHDSEKKKSERQESVSEEQSQEATMCLCGECPAPGAAPAAALRPDLRAETTFAVTIELSEPLAQLKDYVVSAHLRGELKKPVVDPRPCGGIQKDDARTLGSFTIDPDSDQDVATYKIETNDSGVTTFTLNFSAPVDQGFIDSLKAAELAVDLSFKETVEVPRYLDIYNNLSAAVPVSDFSLSVVLAALTIETPEPMSDETLAKEKEDLEYEQNVQAHED